MYSPFRRSYWRIVELGNGLDRENTQFRTHYNADDRRIVQCITKLSASKYNVILLVRVYQHPN